MGRESIRYKEVFHSGINSLPISQIRDARRKRDFSLWLARVHNYPRPARSFLL